MENYEALNTEVFCILKNGLGQFKTAGYSQAVEYYSEALKELSNVPTFQYLEHSILSLKGAALQQEGGYTQALQCITQALTLNKTHELSLLRRAKIYLKIGQIQKGLFDLQSFTSLAPDVDTQTLLQKFQSKVDELQQSEEKYDFKKRINELKNYNFCGLKHIDRKSNISKKKPVKKQSVYFGEEAIFPIEKDEQQTTNKDKNISSGSRLTVEMKESKIKQQLKEQSQIEEKQNCVDFKIISQINPQHKKTILKRQSSIIIPSLLQINSIISEPSSKIDVLRIKDIDGKFVHRTKSQLNKYRQSEIIPNKCARKSILKIRNSEIISGKRDSKFQNILNIDGKVLSSYSSDSYKDLQKSNKSIDSEQQFNVYGKKQMSEDEVNSIVNNWFQQPKSSIENKSSFRKSILKAKSTLIENNPKKRHTVIFKQ